MKQNLAFNFTEDLPQQAPDPDFKKQRAAYLAQRNARKRQAQIILKRQRGHSTSSDDSPSPQKPKTPQKFQERKQNQMVYLSTNSKSQTTDPPAYQEKKQESDHFKKERERYKAERAAHRQEVTRLKRGQFGCSSSSDEDSLPVSKMPKILEIQPQMKEKTLSNNSSSECDSHIMFNSVDLGPQKQKALNQSVRLRMEAGERRRGLERFEVEVPSRKGINIWLEKVLQFRAQTVEIGDRSIPIYDLAKVKLFFVRTPSGACKMKVCCRDEDIFFAVDHKKLHELCLDHYYYIFAKIVTVKLQLMGRNPQPGDRELGCQLSQKQLKGAQLTGKVRKSSFFGGWEPTLGVINQGGLSIYREGKEKPSLVVGYNSVKEIWTRFDFDGDNLIVKLIHNGSKVELSIPVQNYLSRDNWLYHLYNLASK